MTVAELMSAVRVESLQLAVIVAIVYGLRKHFFYAILVFLSLPFVVLSLGLFLVVINAGLLWVTERLVDGFAVDGAMNTILASVFISMLDVVYRAILNRIAGSSD